MNAHVSYQVEPVVRTKLDFHLDQAPRFWFGGDPFRTRMFDALSLTFPDGGLSGFAQNFCGKRRK